MIDTQVSVLQMIKHIILVQSMEKNSFNYSLKNIPLPDKSSHTLKLMEKIESVIKRMRWKAYFYLNKETQEKQQKNTFGLKSWHHLPQCNLLEEFEKDVFDIIKSIKFRKVRNKFQEELTGDLSKIRKSCNMFVFADKTNNVYDREKLILENITKTYQKAPKKIEKAINLEAKSITKSLKLADRIDHVANTEAFITLKDHKENFVNKPT